MSKETSAANDQQPTDRRARGDPEGTAETSVVTSSGARAADRMTSAQGRHSNRQISASVVIQLLFLASLIVGSWVNLQRQLCLLQHDVTYLCQYQKNLQAKFELLHDKSISHEYRLSTIEKHTPKADIAEASLRP